MYNDSEIPLHIKTESQQIRYVLENVLSFVPSQILDTFISIASGDGFIVTVKFRECLPACKSG